jgi:MFS transporter, PAT family, beta-lactamase induction signal transducer AmpG
MTTGNSRKPGLSQLAAEILADPRLALMLALGFSAGLPFLLVFSTLSAWLREAGIQRTEIGFLSYVALAYSFKFLWAPVIDRRDVPFLSRFTGRRRGWMLLSQAGIIVGLIGIASGNPSQSMLWTVTCAFFVAFCSATQDVVVDGWRIDAASTERQGMMSASYQLGYRIALLSAGAGALYIADYSGWKAAYTSMAALMAVGIAASLLAPHPPESKGSGPREPFIKIYAEPIAELLRRKGAAIVPILVLVALYRLPDFVSGVMAIPLYIDLGFTKTAIATVTKLYGVWIGIAGVFAGGIAVLRLGLMPTLLIGVVAASSSHLSLALLSLSGERIEFLTLAISVEAFASGFAGTALIAFMSSLTSPAYAAAQYALLSSLYALPGKLVGGLSGLMVDNFGYPLFFVSTSAIGIPGALLCLHIWRGTLAQSAEGEPGDTPAPAPAIARRSETS